MWDSVRVHIGSSTFDSLLELLNVSDVMEPILFASDTSLFCADKSNSLFQKGNSETEKFSALF